MKVYLFDKSIEDNIKDNSKKYTITKGGRSLSKQETLNKILEKYKDWRLK